MIKLKNIKLVTLLTSKEELVKDGIKITKELEALEAKVTSYENKEKMITKRVKVSPELEEKGNVLAKEINEKIKALDVIAKEIEDIKLAAVPKDMKEAHLALMKKREVLERDRNKIALKIQKIKDRVVPIIKKEVKPLLQNEYDDIETAKVVDGEIVIETFNYLEDFKKKFHKK